MGECFHDCLHCCWYCKKNYVIWYFCLCSSLVGFFWYIFTQPPVWCFQLVFIIQYAVRKNIFTCLFSVYNTRSLSSHEQVLLIRLRFEILLPSFTKKACKFAIKRDPKNFLEVAKEIEHLQQNALVKLRFSDSDSGQV